MFLHVVWHVSAKVSEKPLPLSSELYKHINIPRALINKKHGYRGADKSLARPGKKQATATKL